MIIMLVRPGRAIVWKERGDLLDFEFANRFGRPRGWHAYMLPEWMMPTVATAEGGKSVEHGSNPLFDLWQRVQQEEDSYFDHYERRIGCTHYAWAIPNEEAIDCLVRHSPIVEIGAGSGYWAFLVTARGGDVLAYDRKDGHYKFSRCWFHVQFGTALQAQQHSDRTLFLCWPTEMAARCLKYYRGQKVIYVGEGDGGCTGDDEFHALLHKDWEEIECIRIPQWYGIHDDMTVYRRRRTS